MNSSDSGQLSTADGGIRGRHTAPVSSMGRDVIRVFRKKTLDRLLNDLFYRRTISITAFPIKDFAPRYRVTGKHQDVVRVTPEELPRFSSPFLDPFVEWMKHWVERGDYCFMALINGELAGFIDLMTQTFRDNDGLQIEVEKGECLVRNLQVFPPYRSTAAASLLHDVAFSYARRQGNERIIGPIDRKNIPSLRIAKHVGFREIERVRCGRVFRKLTFSKVLWRSPDRSGGREIVWKTSEGIRGVSFDEVSATFARNARR